LKKFNIEKINNDMATFSEFVFDVTSESPQQIGPSLSGVSNSVILTQPTSASTYSGKKVSGILYDYVAGASTASVSLSVVSGITFSVSPLYHGQTFALYFTDRSSTLFTVNTATATQTVTGAITFDNRGPNERRRFAVEF
jgi:hypothetical protein